MREAFACAILHMLNWEGGFGMQLSDYIPVVALLLVIGLIIYLQYQLGVRKAAAKSALVLPVGYAVLFTVLTIILVPLKMKALLFIGSQWLVADWFYFIYQFGCRHAQAASKVTTEKTDLPAEEEKWDHQ